MDYTIWLCDGVEAVLHWKEKLVKLYTEIHELYKIVVLRMNNCKTERFKLTRRNNRAGNSMDIDGKVYK